MSSTRIVRRISAPRDVVYHALLDARAVAVWMVPARMTGEVHAFDAREGGTFRISLRDESPAAIGENAARADTYHGHFSKLVPNELVVERLELETADPELRGEMTITFALADFAGGTEIRASHEGLPPGVPRADNEAAWRSSLSRLAAWVEGKRGGAAE